MAAGELDFKDLHQIEAGSTYDHVFPFEDEGGSPIPLNGYGGARLQFRATADSTGTPLLEISDQTATFLDEGGSGLDFTTDGVNGNLRVVISAFDSTNLSFDTAGDAPITANRNGSVHCELFILGTTFGGTSPDNDVVLRLFNGTYTITPEAVRP